MLEKLRSIFASAPKTLPQATATLTEAQAQLETLAAELTGRDEKIAALTIELAEAEKQGETATAQLATATSTLALRDSTLSAFAETFSAIGLADITNKTAAADVKAAFETHVAKATTLALAKTGHPPAHVPAATVVETAAATPEAIFAEYQALPAGDLKQAFYAKHEAAIWAGKRAADQKK